MVAVGAVIQGLLRSTDLSEFTVPDFQGRLLDGTGE